MFWCPIIHTCTFTFREVKASASVHVDSIKVLEGEDRRRGQREELIHTLLTRVSTFSAGTLAKREFPPGWNSKRRLRENTK